MRDVKRVAIICYSYSDGYAYHEQKLAKAFVDLGYEVRIICSTANRTGPTEVVNIKPSVYETEDRYTVQRLPFLTGGNGSDHRMPIILRYMYDAINAFEPDLIYHMSVSAINLIQIGKYCKNHPETSLFVDNHASLHNSANNFVSKNILHKLIFKNIVKSVDKYILRYFYVGSQEKIFLTDFYDIPNERTEFFPLCDSLFSDEDNKRLRDESRKVYGYGNNDIVIAYSGKFTRAKRTIELLKMFVQLNQQNNRIKLLLIGGIQDYEIEECFNSMIKENANSITFVGWTESSELKKILCGADLYIQAAASSTLQTSICCGCASFIVDETGVYSSYPAGGFFTCSCIEDMKKKIGEITSENQMETLHQAAFEYAKANFDIEKLIRDKIIRANV